MRWHESIAALRTAPDPEDVAHQPASAGRIPHVEPAIVNVQHEATPRTQQPKNVRDDGTPIGGAQHHAERAEQTGRVVERRRDERVEMHEVGTKKIDRHAGGARFRRRDGEHRLRQIDAEDTIPALCQRHEQSTRAAPQIEQPTGPRTLVQHVFDIERE